LTSGKFLREVLYNILLEFCIDKKPLIVIKMCLNETYSEVCIGKFSSDKFFYSEWAEKGDDLLILYFNFALEYAIKKVEGNRISLELNGTYQLFVYADYVNLLGDSENTIKEYSEIILEASRNIGLEKMQRRQSI
jgi:hypothetical protein